MKVPARRASVSPSTALMVGVPLRVRASSKMSSWTSDPTWTNSTAAAAAITRGLGAPTMPAMARVRAGLRRFPPPETTRTQAAVKAGSPAEQASTRRVSTAARRSGISETPSSPSGESMASR